MRIFINPSGIECTKFNKEKMRKVIILFSLFLSAMVRFNISLFNLKPVVEIFEAVPSLLAATEICASVALPWVKWGTERKYRHSEHC